MKLRTLLSSEVVRYGMISVVALAVDMALLALLTQILHVHYLLAATCSFLAGGVVAYLLCVRFVFRYHRLQVRFMEAVAFVALGVAGLGVNTVVMAVLVGRGGLPVLSGKAVAACATFGVNFLLRKLALFTPRGVEVVK
jgi:putative flippase GtrA